MVLCDNYWGWVGEEELCYSIRILVYSIRSKGGGGMYTVWGYCGGFDGTFQGNTRTSLTSYRVHWKISMSREGCVVLYNLINKHTQNEKLLTMPAVLHATARSAAFALASARLRRSLRQIIHRCTRTVLGRRQQQEAS